MKDHTSDNLNFIQKNTAREIKSIEQDIAFGQFQGLQLEAQKLNLAILKVKLKTCEALIYYKKKISRSWKY